MCIEVAQKAGYVYYDADTLREDKSTVVVDSLLHEAIVKINNITDEEAQIVFLNNSLTTPKMRICFQR